MAHDVGSALCVGSEWHRFPSSFLVPDYVKEVRWIDDGFNGLLPFPFNSTLGGTSAAPSYFNNKNQASDQQYVSHLSIVLIFSVHNSYSTLKTNLVHSLMFLLLMLQFHDVDKCTFLVELHLQRPYVPRGSDLNTWEVSLSPSLCIYVCVSTHLNLFTCKTFRKIPVREEPPTQRV